MSAHSPLSHACTPHTQQTLSLPQSTCTIQLLKVIRFFSPVPGKSLLPKEVISNAIVGPPLPPPHHILHPGACYLTNQVMSFQQRCRDILESLAIVGILLVMAYSFLRQRQLFGLFTNLPPPHPHHPPVRHTLRLPWATQK